MLKIFLSFGQDFHEEKKMMNGSDDEDEDDDDDDDDDGEQRCLCGICGTLANAHISSGIRTSQGGNCTANASHDQLMMIIIIMLTKIAKNMWVCFLKIFIFGSSRIS